MQIHKIIRSHFVYTFTYTQTHTHGKSPHNKNAARNETPRALLVVYRVVFTLLSICFLHPLRRHTSLSSSLLSKHSAASSHAAATRKKNTWTRRERQAQTSLLSADNDDNDDDENAATYSRRIHQTKRTGSFCIVHMYII